jgi:large subunit ribosomal protein L22
MSKKPAPRRLADTEVRAFAQQIRTSPRKLNLVAELIRGLSAEAALNQLTFSRRRIAKDVKKLLQSAIANAENNHQLDVDRLVVAEAYVGKALVMKRMHTRGRGRSARIEKPFSNLTVIVRERAEAASKAKAAAQEKE